MKSPITNQILEIIRSFSYRNEISLSEFGRRADISKAWLSKLKNTDANLSVETASKLLAAAGYKLQVVKTQTQAEVKSRLKKVAQCQKE